MIQAPLPKPVETPKAKAPQAEASEVSSKSNAPKAIAAKEAKKQEAKEFVKELETSMEETSADVKPVQVSLEQTLELPSELVQPTGTIDTTSQKVFDPSLTKGVEKLIQPKTSEAEVAPLTDAQVLELAETSPEEMKGEFTQAMLKTPQLAQVQTTTQGTGRAPAIEFAKSEIDPQLLNNEDFVVQKNLVAKKSMPNAYGMKQMPMQKQEAMIHDLKQSQVIQENNALPTNSESMNSQQFILNLQSDMKAPQTQEAHAPAKVFDMGHIKTTNANEIMTKITDYVVQAKAAKEPTVNMRMKHDELGMIDITVSKSGVNHEAIAVNIGTHSVEGKNFFQQNSKDLVSHLSNAGLSISDLKVETPTQTAKNDFNFGSQSGRNNQQGSERQFGSEQNQRRHESDRRQDLWKLLNKEAA